MWYRSDRHKWLVCLFFWSGWLLSIGNLSAQPSMHVSAGAQGAGRFAPHTWGLLTATVENPEDHPRDFLGVVSVDDAPATQFVQELWLPPRSRLTRAIPFYIEQIAPGSKSLAVTALLSPRDQPNLAFSRQPVLLVTELSNSRFTVVAEPSDEVPMNLCLAMRRSMSLDERLLFMRPSSMPSVPSAYQIVDQLLLARADLHLDSAQLAALRQWLVQGGRLWIMADLVPPAILQALLVEQEAPQPLGRVELHDVTIEGGGLATQMTSERPIPLVRMTATPDWEVLLTVQGWPAAMRLGVGQGQVVVTTLGPRAWVDDKGQLRAASEPLARIMLQRTVKTTRELVQWDRFLLEQIGYRVISRNVVLGVLGGFLVVFLVVGLWLDRQGRMEHMGWIGAILAVIGGAALLVMGMVHRQDTPSTVVTSDLVQVIPRQRVALAQGQMQIYNRRQDSQAVISATRGGELLPTITNRQGQEVVSAGRLVWSDLDRWQWERLNLPENAVATSRFAVGLFLEESTVAKMTFGPEGVMIQTQGAWLEHMEDVLLVGPSGRLSPKPMSSGRWRAGLSEKLPPTQYIYGVMSGQQQQLRQQIYRSLFELPQAGADEDHSPTPVRMGQGIVAMWKPTQPTLLGWTQAVPLGISSSLDARRVNWSLIQVPLEIERPAVGARILIPGALVRHEIVRSDVSGTGPRASRAGRLTTAYDEGRGQWLAINQGGMVPVKFSVPTALLPLQLESAQLSLDIRAAGRTVAIQWWEGDRAVTLSQRESPLGVMQVTLSSAVLGQIQDQGSLTLLIHVSEAEDAATYGQPWKIQSLGMDVTAVVAEP